MSKNWKHITADLALSIDDIVGVARCGPCDLDFYMSNGKTLRAVFDSGEKRDGVFACFGTAEIDQLSERLTPIGFP